MEGLTVVERVKVKKRIRNAGTMTLGAVGTVGILVSVPFGLFKAFNIPSEWHAIVSGAGLLLIGLFFLGTLSWQDFWRSIRDLPIEGFDHKKAKNLTSLAGAALDNLPAKQSSPVSMSAGLAVKYVLLEIVHRRLLHLSTVSMRRVRDELDNEAVDKDGNLIGNPDGFDRVAKGISQLSNDLDQVVIEKKKWLEFIEPLLEKTDLLESVESFCGRLHSIGGHFVDWSSWDEDRLLEEAPTIIRKIPDLQERLKMVQDEITKLNQSLGGDMRSCQDLMSHLEDL